MRTPSLVAKEQYLFLGYIFCAFIAIQFVCDILVMRLIHIGALEFTASSAIFCLDFAFMDVIANVYGMQEARRLAFINFGAQLFIGATLFLSLYNFDPLSYANQAYQVTAIQVKGFGLFMSKILLFSPVAVLVGNLSNGILMTTSKYLLYGRFIAVRSLICSLAAALIMLSLSYTFFYWHTGVQYVVHVVLSSMVIKVIGGALFMFPAQYFSNVLKKVEGVDVYDLKFKFLRARQDKITRMLTEKKGSKWFKS